MAKYYPFKVKCSCGATTMMSRGDLKLVSLKCGQCGKAGHFKYIKATKSERRMGLIHKLRGDQKSIVANVEALQAQVDSGEIPFDVAVSMYGLTPELRAEAKELGIKVIELKKPHKRSSRKSRRAASGQKKERVSRSSPPGDVKALLNLLHNSEDKAEKRRIRGRLRSLGHVGGLRNID